MSSYISLAPYYDDLTRDVPYNVFADFYKQIFDEYDVSPKTILDLACGTGTLTCMMAQRGYELIGIDSSSDMLVEAYEKSFELMDCVRPVFVCQTMEGLDLYGTVSAAFCSLDGINYVPEDTLAAVFKRLRLFIEPDGVFIFDVISPQKLKDQDGEIYIDELEDVFCVWRASFNESENACIYGMDVFCHEKNDFWVRGNEEHIEYAHDVKMLCEKLEDAGFGEISVYDGYSKENPLKEEKRIFIAARRM